MVKWPRSGAMATINARRNRLAPRSSGPRSCGSWAASRSSWTWISFSRHNHSAYGRRDAGVAARPLRPAANLLSGGSWPALKLSGSDPIGLLLLKTLAVSGEQNQPGNPKRAASSRNFRDAQGTARDMPGFAGVCTAERNYVSGAKRGASRARTLWPPVSMQRRSDDSHTK